MLRFLLTHLVVGVCAGWLTLAAFVALDIANLRTLIFGSPDGVVALVMLAFFFALTFGSLGMGFGVMSQPRDDGDDDDRRSGGGGGRRQAGARDARMFTPIPVRATRAKPAAR